MDHLYTGWIRQEGYQIVCWRQLTWVQLSPPVYQDHLVSQSAGVCGKCPTAPPTAPGTEQHFPQTAPLGCARWWYVAMDSRMNVNNNKNKIKKQDMTSKNFSVIVEEVTIAEKYDTYILAISEIGLLFQPEKSFRFLPRFIHWAFKHHDCYLHTNTTMFYSKARTNTNSQ